MIRLFETNNKSSVELLLGHSNIFLTAILCLMDSVIRYIMTILNPQALN